VTAVFRHPGGRHLRDHERHRLGGDAHPRDLQRQYLLATDDPPRPTVTVLVTFDVTYDPWLNYVSYVDDDTLSAMARPSGARRDGLSEHLPPEHQQRQRCRQRSRHARVAHQCADSTTLVA